MQRRCVMRTQLGVSTAGVYTHWQRQAWEFAWRRMHASRALDG